MRSMPMSCPHSSSAGSDQKPEVVRVNGSLNTSRNGFLSEPCRFSAMLMRHIRNGRPSPRCPMMKRRFGYLSNTPLRHRRTPWVAVSTVKPQAARRIPGHSGTKSW